jgi:hypothetical protein
MTSISPLSRATPVVSSATSAAAPGVPAAVAGAPVPPAGESTVVSLGGAAEKLATPSLVWENRFRSASSTLMARNFTDQAPAGRLKGLGAELLKQVAYDGADFAQSVQQAPAGVDAGTYDMLVMPTQVSQHGMGDNQFKLSITTRSGVKVDLALDAGDNSIAVDVRSSAKLNDAEREALRKLADAFQQSIDGLAEGRIDLGGLTQFDSGVLSSVDLKAQVKLGPAETQQLQFHADTRQRTVSFTGPAGSAKIGVDLSQPASWGSKEQQAKALNRYLQQVDQAGLRGQGNGNMLGMFKDAFTAMNSDYGKPAPAPRAIYLSDQDRALTTGLADFTASMSQTEVASNPMRATEKDTFAYELSQKTSITGHTQLDRAITQQQQSRLKATYHEPIKADARLALDLRPESQNYKFVSIDDSASSKTSIGYEKGALVQAALAMQASQTSRVLTYTLGKLKDDHTTPSAKVSTRDLLTTLEPERAGLPTLDGDQRERMLSKLNEQMFLQSNPNAIAG